MESTPSPTPSNETNNNTISLSVSKLTSVPFLLGLLLFLSPFIDIRCNNVSLQQVSGINLATGFEVKTDNNSLFGNLGKDDGIDIKKTGKKDGNVYAFAALLIGIAGFVICLLKFKGKELLGTIAGVGAAASLIGLMIDVKSQLKLDLTAKSDFANVRVAIDFTPWFYIAVLLFLIGAYLSYKGGQRKT